jgi:hypothetical protein
MAEMIQGKTEEETIRLTMEATGRPREWVLFYLAVSRGQIAGDVIIDGDETLQDPDIKPIVDLPELSD